MHSALVTLHGGCFVGGHSGYDREQTSFLRSLGLEVYQIDFDKSCLKNSIESIVDTVSQINRTNKQLVVLGRSSGGYLAKVLFDMGVFDKAVYLAPVFDPETRGRLVPILGQKQRRFFAGQEIYDTRSFNPEKELLFLANDDKNVPLECFTEEQLNNAIYLGIQTHEGLLKTTSRAFQEDLLRFLED